MNCIMAVPSGLSVTSTSKLSGRVPDLARYAEAESRILFVEIKRLVHRAGVLIATSRYQLVT